LALRRDLRIQENDHAQFDSGSKQRARQKDCKKPLPADSRNHAVCGLRVCRAGDACVSHAPLHEVRLPRIDSRVIENLQRWAEGDKDPWSEEI